MASDLLFSRFMSSFMDAQSNEQPDHAAGTAGLAGPWADRAPLGGVGQSASMPQPGNPAEGQPEPQANAANPGALGQLFAHFAEGGKRRGIPLPGSVRARMEATTGESMDGVRLQTDEPAAAMTQSVDAAAFTVGQDIFFGSGQYQPDTAEGQDLLMHEAVHTLQQRGSDSGPPTSMSEPGAADELEADELTAAAWLGRRRGTVGRTPGRKIQRRKITESEKAVFKRLELFSEKAGEEEVPKPAGDLALAQDIIGVKVDLESQIQSVKEEKKSLLGFQYTPDQSPPALKAALWSLHQWAGQKTDGVGNYAYSQPLPENGLEVQSLDADSYKCNRFVGDAYAIGANKGYAVNGKGGGYPTGERSLLARLFGKSYGYPRAANELANPSLQIPNMQVTQNPVVGDIMAFASSGGPGHSGINLGHNLFISARNSASRPVPSMQAQDGVHIKRPVSGGVFRHYSE